MVYLISIFVFLMILAPVLAILPSAKQRDQLKKRKLAMARGVRVQLTHIDDPDQDPAKYLSNTGKPLARKLPIVAYRLARPRPEMWREGVVNEWALHRDLRGSESTFFDFGVRGWHCVDRPPNGFEESWKNFFQLKLPRLPADVVRVEEKKYMLTIFWNEEGEVDEILEFLSTCAQLTIVD
ncbi:MAG: hypothetical protein ACI9FB_000214 [Candidatus Azotimanducaceae bacterium]